MNHNKIARRSLISFVLLFFGCKKQEQPMDKKSDWLSKTRAILEDGTPIDICVYNEPLNGNGFVINVHRPDDPPGRCWGTTIYPKPID